jgi:hypothetical protein
VEQLTALERAKMPVICHQNEVGLAHKGDTIVAWMHGNEPDNAQGRRLRGFKPPIASLTDQASDVRLKIKGKRSGKVHALDGSKPPKLTGGTLKLGLAPYRVARYRISR